MAPSFLSIALIASIFATTYTLPDTTTYYHNRSGYNSPSPAASASYSEPLSVAQRAWLDALEACESSGSTTVRIIDSNGKYSTGRFQFQTETFRHYGVLYGILPPETTFEEADRLVFDPMLQGRIAHRMLLNGGEYHWKNCSARIGHGYPTASASSAAQAS